MLLADASKRMNLCRCEYAQALGERVSMHDVVSSATAAAALRRFGEMVAAVGQRVKASRRDGSAFERHHLCQ